MKEIDFQQPVNKLEDEPSSEINNGNSHYLNHRSYLFRTFRTIVFVAIFAATAFTMWTPENLFSNNLLDKMILALQSPTQINAEDQSIDVLDTPEINQKIGIVAGHWKSDSGAVCPDGLTEQEVNLTIATMVRQYLLAEGYDVDLLEEFDQRLYQYKAQVLVSIHNDSCVYINDEATGFKVAAAKSTSNPEKANRLTACLINRYMQITNLPFHANTITPDMSDYHAFREVSPDTTAVIIETGFLNLDRQILTQHPDLIAQGVTSGILCYLKNEPISIQEVTPAP